MKFICSALFLIILSTPIARSAEQRCLDIEDFDRVTGDTVDSQQLLADAVALASSGKTLDEKLSHYNGGLWAHVKRVPYSVILPHLESMESELRRDVPLALEHIQWLAVLADFHRVYENNDRAVQLLQEAEKAAWEASDGGRLQWIGTLDSGSSTQTSGVLTGVVIGLVTAGKTEEALALIDRMEAAELENAPDKAYVRLLQATMAFHDRDFENAEQWAEAVITESSDANHIFAAHQFAALARRALRPDDEMAFAELFAFLSTPTQLGIGEFYSLLAAAQSLHANGAEKEGLNILEKALVNYRSEPDGYIAQKLNDLSALARGFLNVGEPDRAYSLRAELKTILTDPEWLQRLAAEQEARKVWVNIDYEMAEVGQLEAAAGHFQDAWSTFEQLRSDEHKLRVLAAIVVQHARKGHLDGACELYRRAVDMANALKAASPDGSSPTDALETRAEVLVSLNSELALALAKAGHMDAAQRRLTAASAAARQIGEPGWTASRLLNEVTVAAYQLEELSDHSSKPTGSAAP